MSRIAEAMLPSPYRDGDPGHKEGTTSRLAAMQAREDATILRSLVLARIAEVPSTADEVAAALGRSVLSIRPRVSELRELKKVRPRLRPDGRQERRKNASGVSAIVWEAGEERTEDAEA